MADAAPSHASGWAFARIRKHTIELVRLAVPVVIARAGIMTMALVDTIMVGRYATADLAYQGLGLAPVGFLMVTGLGLVMGTLVLASKAYGAGTPKEAGAVWRRSVPYAFWIGVLAACILAVMEPVFLLMGQDPMIAKGAGEVALVTGLGLPLSLVFMSSTYFLEAIGRPKPGMVIMISANGVNVVLNWLFIYGNLGFPEMGAVGSAWATTGVRIFIGVSIVLYIWHMPGWDELGVRLKPEGGWSSWARLRSIGFASAISTGVESLAFSLMTIFAGYVSAVALASYSIGLNSMAMVFMIAIGLGTATSARVGNARGRGDYSDMALAGWTGLGVTMAAMAVFGGTLIAFAEPVARIYTSDPAVVSLASAMLTIIGIAIVVDGGQATMAFALRGRGDVWVPSVLHTVTYFFLMIPLAWYLIFVMDRGGISVVEAIFVASIWSVVVLTGRFAYLARRDRLAGEVTSPH